MNASGRQNGHAKNGGAARRPGANGSGLPRFGGASAGYVELVGPIDFDSAADVALASIRILSVIARGPLGIAGAMSVDEIAQAANVDARVVARVAPTIRAGQFGVVAAPALGRGSPMVLRFMLANAAATRDAAERVEDEIETLREQVLVLRETADALAWDDAPATTQRLARRGANGEQAAPAA